MTLADVWRRYDAIESRLTAGVSERILDLAGIHEGMRVLDIATGRGEPALRAAVRVGTTGSVVGFDAAADVLAIARLAAIVACSCAPPNNCTTETWSSRSERELENFHHRDAETQRDRGSKSFQDRQPRSRCGTASRPQQAT